MTTAQLSSEHEIQSAYSGTRTASAYVGERFRSELNRVLHERQVAAVNHVMQTARPAQALEIAPGPGRVTRDVRPAGQLTCLEFNEGMIEEGRRACRNGAEFVQGNAFELPFEPGTFDFAYTFRFIRHFHDDDRSRLYAQIASVLKPGGTLVFDAVNERQSKPLRDATPESYPVYDVLYREADLRSELTAAGFTDIQLEVVQKRYRWQYLSETLIGPRSRGLNRLIVRGLEALPARDGLEWIVTCRRS